MRVKKLTFFLILICGLLFASCGRPGKTDTNSQIPSYDWQTKGFVVGNATAAGLQTTPALTDDPSLFPVDYKAIENILPENVEAGSASFVTDGSNVYVNNRFFAEESWHNAVWKVDGEGSISPSMSITEDMWGIKDGKVEGMDVLNPEQYVFWVASDVQEDEKGYRYAGHFYAIYTDADGKEQRRTDLIDFLKEQNLWKGYGNAVTYSGNQISCDSQGNIYLYDWERRAMYLLDPEGELLTSYIYQQTGADNFIYSLRADSGEEILVCKSDRGMEFIWMDPESRQVKNLAVAEKFDNVQKWYGLWGDTLYYATRSQIIGWNVAIGEKRGLINLAENEIRDVDRAFFLRTATGGRVLFSGGNRQYLLTFSTEKPQVQGEIQVANLVGQDTFLKGRVVTFSRENPLFGIEYVEAYEEANASRVLMEMANGKGPAIAYISREDMENLRSKGALADLNEILSEENLKAMLPGVIELGTYSSGLYGLPVMIDSIDTVCVGSAYYQGDTWTVGDVMTVLEAHPELEGLFANYQIDYYQNMVVLLSKDLEHSPFIQNGKARFDSKEFQELLATVKARGNAEEIVTGEYKEIIELIREGKILGAREMIFNLLWFCLSKPDDCYYIGFPTETGKGTYLVTENGVLVVNQNVAEKEEVRLLLNYLFSLESQQRVSNISVRLDVPETLIMYDYLGRPAIRDFSEGGWSLLDEYDETYMEEYINLLKSAVPRPVGSAQIFAIIWEEAEPYFYSDKSLEAVCDAIQRRVQLYLDEEN